LFGDDKVCVFCALTLVGALFILGRFNMNPHNKRVFESMLYGGLGLCLLGFLLALSRVAPVFGVICFGAGIILFVISLCYRFINAPLPNAPSQKPKEEKITDITRLVMLKSRSDFMDIARGIAEDLGKVDNFEKKRRCLEEKISLLQEYYGYALQNLENRSQALTALCLYYILNADGLIYIYTRQATTDKQFTDIFQLILDELDNNEFGNDPDFFMKNIVDGYFLWRQESIPLENE